MIKFPWFRFYSETVNDRKILRVCRVTGQPKAIVIGVWVTMLCLANESPQRGSLLISDDLPINDEEIQLETGIDLQNLTNIINTFVDFGMVSKSGCYDIVNWNERQRKSDSSTERVRRHRAKKHEETLQERYSNALERDKEGDIDIDIDKNNMSATAADYQEIRNQWIQHFPDKPKPRASNKTLQTKVKTRIKSDHFKENWSLALDRASSSEFLRNGSWFDLSWFLANDSNYEKCLNGKYDNRASKNAIVSDPYYDEETNY